MEEASSVLLRIDGGRGELLEHVLGRRAPLLLRTNRAPGINQAPCTDGGGVDKLLCHSYMSSSSTPALIWFEEEGRGRGAPTSRRALLRRAIWSPSVTPVWIRVASHGGGEREKGEVLGFNSFYRSSRFHISVEYSFSSHYIPSSVNQTLKMRVEHLRLQNNTP
jgi:hypothetical protein